MSTLTISVTAGNGDRFRHRARLGRSQPPRHRRSQLRRLRHRQRHDPDAFFKAGIAGDGNYNRSLTPAGFQREDRYLWEAQDVYVEMSPFFQADRLSGALLMYHGMDDHNTGTHPIHADRMFHALDVLGKTASMYKYPFEDHCPATRETTLDLWARWVAWLDTFVKNPRKPPRSTPRTAVTGNGCLTTGRPTTPVGRPAGSLHGSRRSAEHAPVVPEAG